MFLAVACGGGGDEGKPKADAARDLGADLDVSPMLDTGATIADTGIVADTTRAEVSPDTVVAPADVGLPPVDATGDTPIIISDPYPDASRADAGIAETSAIPDTAPRLDVSVAETALTDTTPDNSPTDTTVSDTAILGLDASSSDTVAAADALASDTNPISLPQLASLNTTSGNAGASFSLTLTGSNFSAGAIAYFDNQAVPTLVLGSTSITAQISSGLTGQAGQHSIWVRNVGGALSNTLYFEILPLAGAPEIVDYNPDNGVVGDQILIVGKNLSGTLTITGPGGQTAVAGTTGSISWWTQTLETVQITIPTGWQTGAITIANAQGLSRGKTFNVGRNLARIAGVTIEASTEFSASWPKAQGADNDLASSWFSAVGDCATSTSCTTVPWFTVTFPTVQTVSRIAMRGNREYASGYDYIRGRFDILAVGGATLWTGSFSLPEPDRDLDIILPTPIAGAAKVRFTSLQDESSEPGFAELEIF